MNNVKLEEIDAAVGKVLQKHKWTKLGHLMMWGPLIGTVYGLWQIFQAVVFYIFVLKP